jgi:hypothetical protein
MFATEFADVRSNARSPATTFARFAAVGDAVDAAAEEDGAWSAADRDAGVEDVRARSVTAGVTRRQSSCQGGREHGGGLAVTRAGGPSGSAWRRTDRIDCGWPGVPEYGQRRCIISARLDGAGGSASRRCACGAGAAGGGAAAVIGAATIVPRGHAVLGRAAWVDDLRAGPTAAPGPG